MTHLTFDCRHRFDSGFELDVQFEVDGRVVALVGPSGAGKTTLAKMIAGLVRPQRGTIRLGDRVVTDTVRRIHLAPERRRVGVLFQDPYLFPHLSVRQNIFYGKRRRQAGSLDVSRVVEVLEIQDLLARCPVTLSGGQQQRVALARALASQPDWLLLDEPLTAVEAALRERILDYLERLNRQFAVPTLLISHQRQVIERLADQVVEIEAGRIVGANCSVPPTRG